VNARKARALTPILIGIATAAVVGVAMLEGPDWLKPMVRVVACYDAGVVAMLILHWGGAMRADAAQTRARAATQDPGRDAVFVLTLMAVAFGFVAAFDVLGPGPRDRRPEHEAIFYALALAAVALGWLLIHTIFSFRYAHLYYRTRDKESDPSLIFPRDDAPSFLDFAYFSFVIGMTFQVSDVQVTSKGTRRLVLAHGMISFAYNTAILALVVNVVSGLLH
jgi:uncharacterized membrane protein